MKTIPLYDREPFAKEFSARVISCQEEITGEKKLYKVVLDQTMFSQSRAVSLVTRVRWIQQLFWMCRLRMR